MTKKAKLKIKIPRVKPRQTSLNAALRNTKSGRMNKPAYKELKAKLKNDSKEEYYEL